MNRATRITGLVLHILVGGMMIFAGSIKVFGLAPPEMVEAMSKSGLGDKLLLIGAGELTSALLLLIPRMMSLGTLLTSGFWGGVISFHMAHHEPYAIPSILLAVTWVGAYLRDPRTLASFHSQPPLATPP